MISKADEDLYGSIEVRRLENILDLSAWAQWCTGPRDHLTYEIDEFVEGELFHCDSLIQNGRIVWSNACKNVNPCMQFALADRSARLISGLSKPTPLRCVNSIGACWRRSIRPMAQRIWSASRQSPGSWCSWRSLPDRPAGTWSGSTGIASASIWMSRTLCCAPGAVPARAQRYTQIWRLDHSSEAAGPSKGSPPAAAAQRASDRAEYRCRRNNRYRKSPYRRGAGRLSSGCTAAIMRD